MLGEILELSGPEAADVLEISPALFRKRLQHARTAVVAFMPWHIGRMPALIHTLPISLTWNGRPDPLGGAADGMLIETSHVTVQGLRILGMPVVESPRPVSRLLPEAGTTVRDAAAR